MNWRWPLREGSFLSGRFLDTSVSKRVSGDGMGKNTFMGVGFIPGDGSPLFGQTPDNAATTKGTFTTIHAITVQLNRSRPLDLFAQKICFAAVSLSTA
jgi:hypothetical protein